MNRRHPKRLRRVFTIDTADVRVFIGGKDIGSARDVFCATHVAMDPCDPQPPDDGRRREDRPAR